MSSQRWQQVEEIFQNALDLPASERAAYLDRVCRDESELRGEVETLLKHHEESGDLLEQPVYEKSGIHDLASLMDSNVDPLIGQRLGAYRVEREIGRGGMGVVYLAERADDLFQRRVAIKVIKRGMDTDFVLQRFRHERRIVAALDHPNIARLLDGGATDSGLPYFVMEYIEGQPLYAYCDSRRLGVQQRLRLMTQVCDAVHHAHQLKIIHRDIKPNNILVTPAGIPKLIDFGIAKLLNPELSSDTSPMTGTAMRLMTIDYASPEQVEGSPVTHLSDVYSLGLLLYELLSGHRPYHFPNRQPADMARVICEDQPMLPSLAIGHAENFVAGAEAHAEAMTIQQVCELRNETLESLRRKLSGSLDDITLKALRKNPAERYESAVAFRTDIERYLQGQPVSAAQFSVSVPEAKTVIRQAGDTSVAVLPFKVMGGKPASDTDDYLGVGLADALITRLSNVRRLVVRPTSSVLKYGETGDPFEAGRQLAVDYIVDGNIRRAGDTLRVTVQLLNVGTIAVTWAGKFDETSLDVLRLEDLISEQVAGALIPQLTREEQQQLSKRGTDNAQAYAAYLRGRYFWNKFTPESLPKAIESFQTAIAFDTNYALAYVGVADIYNWAAIYGIQPAPECYAKSRAAATRALELDPTLGEAYAALALMTESAEWDWKEAERLFLRALELNPNYSLAHEWYSSTLVGTGRFQQGVNEIRRAEELDPRSLRAMTLTAWTTYQARRFSESIAKAEQIIALDRTYFQGYLQRGINLVQLGRANEAVVALRQAVVLLPNSALPKYELCFALVAAGRAEEARQVLFEIQALAGRRYVKPYFIAMAHAALDQRDEAFAWFERVFAEHDPWLVWFGTDPKLDPLRTDPRFNRLFRRTGNPLAEKERQ